MAATKQTTGHTFDGIEELNNPLPRWWLGLFWASILFSVIYLLLYPGLGGYPGLLRWSSARQWTEEVKQAEQQYAPIFAQYAAKPVEELVNHPAALKIGQRLFLNHCAACHGSDARGGPGFPNLTDDNWQYGRTAEAIKTTITQGRTGFMPAMGELVGDEAGIESVAAYVRSLNGYEHESVQVEQGEKIFTSVCAACHGADAKGNPLLGAPDLTNDQWVYGGSLEAIKDTIRWGRSGKMPAQKDILSAEQIHLLTAYVLSLHESSPSVN